MKTLKRAAAVAVAAVVVAGISVGPASAVSWGGWSSTAGDYWGHRSSGSQWHGQSQQTNGTWKASTTMRGFALQLQARYTANGKTIVVGPLFGSDVVSTVQDRISAHNPGF